MKSKILKKILLLSLAFIFIINTSVLFASDKINIPKSVTIYYTAADAKNRTNSKGTWSAGDYYVFTRYDGMINISNSSSQPGAWINPNDFKSGSIEITPDVPILTIESTINRYSSFVVYSDMKGYRSASDAYNSNSPVTTLSSGIYYVLSASNNMIEISKTKSNTGYWINPALNSGSYKTANDYTTSEFINEIGPLAQRLAAEHDLYASVMMAQAILESGWGNSLLANKPFHNLFGVKGSYNSDSILIKTFEYTSSGNRYDVLANFRKYPSYLESLKDYVYVLTGDDDKSSWNYNFYLGVRKSRTSNYKEATNYLTGRYATSPAYANSLNSLIETYNLTRFDELGPKVSGYTTRSYNLRDGASINSKVVGLLKAGTYIEGHKVENFIKLSNGAYVYNGPLLKELKKVSGYLKSDANVSNHPDQKVVDRYKQGQYIEGYSLGNYILLENGKFIKNVGLEIGEKVSGYTTKSYNLRDDGNLNSKVIGLLKAGSYVEGYKIGNFIKLSERKYVYNGNLLDVLQNISGNIAEKSNVARHPDDKTINTLEEGSYVNGKDLGEWILLENGNYVENKGFISANSSQHGKKVSGNIDRIMNIRKAPSTNSSIVGQKYSGDYIEGYRIDGWVKISDGNYIHDSGISNISVLDTDSVPKGIKVSGKLINTMNVRKEPSTNSSIVGSKSVGEYIEGYLNDGWIKLSDGNYIHESGLSNISVPKGTKVSGKLINTMNVRKEPSTNSSIVGSKSVGEYIEGYLNDSWIKLSDGNYIHESGLLNNSVLKGKKVSGYLIKTMNVRKEANTNSSIVAIKYVGEYIEGYLNEGWIKLSDGNYIHESGLDI